MKKAVFIFVLAGLFFSANAQDGLQIVDPGKMWSYMEYTNFPPWYKKTYYHKFMGDTVIDQLTYVKVWQSEDENYQSWTPNGYIRSDENGDVYCLSNNFYGGLIYRFDVQVGDTFTIYNPSSWQFQVEVLSVDSVFVSPLGQYRKRIVLTAPEVGWATEESWIEGIGSMAGILNSGFQAVPLTGSWYDMLCEWQDGTKVFSNPDWPYCFMTTVSTPETPENKQGITIFPMPLVSNSVIGINKQLKNGRIIIVDVFGKTIKEIAVSGRESIPIQKGGFKPGVYIVLLYDGVRFVERVKLTVQ
ncbi:MAG: T9SS type A sorting domain-containing protein [Chlorobi bacterium]|nr:T9SS type A sorting domain-containing protein [Chlorobiota bacterium]